MANFESPDDMMLKGPKGTRKRSKTVNEMSSKELQNYAMKYARENNMSESAAIELFGSKIKKKQAEESKGKEKNQMSKGGKATKKAEMMGGGMANKKDHKYATGGMVKSKY